jgi:hypothetical protein
VKFYCPLAIVEGLASVVGHRTRDIVLFWGLQPLARREVRAQDAFRNAALVNVQVDGLIPSHGGDEALLVGDLIRKIDDGLLALIAALDIALILVPRSQGVVPVRARDGVSQALFENGVSWRLPHLLGENAVIPFHSG